MARQVKFEGRTLSVPDDATDDEVAAIIESSGPAAPPTNGPDFAKAQGIPALPSAPPAAAAPRAPAEKPGLLQQFGKAVMDTPDVITSLVSSTIGGPIVSAARAGATLVGADPDKVGAAVSPYVVREPQTDSARSVLDTAGKAMEPLMGVITEPAEKIGNALRNTGNPKAANFADKAGVFAADVAGAAGGVAALKGPRATPQVPARAKVPATAIERGRAEGLDVLPSSGGAGFIGRTMEGIAGSRNVAARIQQKNQPKVNAAAKQELGLSEADRFDDPEVFTREKAKENANYTALAQVVPEVQFSPQYARQVADLPRGSAVQPNKDIAALQDAFGRLDRLTGDELLSEIQSLRDKANSNLSVQYGAENRSEWKALGKAQKQMANILESELKRVSPPDAFAAYQQSRVRLAKLGSVERAIKGGDVDAIELRKQWDNDVPLTGKLKLLAELAEKTPESIKRPGEGVAGAADDVSKSLSGGIPIIGDALLGRFLASDKYQNTLAKPSGRESLSSPGPAEFPPDRRPPPPPPEPVAPSPGNPDMPPGEGMRFTASPNPRAPGMAGDLGLVEDAPFKRPAPEAAGTLGDDLNTVPWDAEASPGGPFEFTKGERFTPPNAPNPTGPYSWQQLQEAGRQPPRTNDLTLDGPGVEGVDFTPPEAPTGGPNPPPYAPRLGDMAEPPPVRQEQPAQQQQAQPARTFAEDMGLTIEPDARAPGYFKVVAPSGEPVASLPSKRAAEQLIEEAAFTEPPATDVPPRAPPERVKGFGLRPLGEEITAAPVKSKFKHTVDETGQHTIESDSNGLVLQDNGTSLKVKYTNTKPESRKQGLGTEAMKEAFRIAQAEGKTVQSDFSVSPDQQHVYMRLMRDGYTVKENPATISEDTGGLVSNDLRVPVYEITAGPSNGAR